MSTLAERLRRQLGAPSEQAGARAPPEQDAGTGVAAPLGLSAEPPGPLSVLERLRRLSSTSLSPPVEAREPKAFLPPKPADPARPVCLAPGVPLEEVERDGVACLWGRAQLAPDTRHGALSLGSAQLLDGPAAVVLTGSSELVDFDVRRALFFDLETSGLLGGSGNLAFLSGAARVLRDGSVLLHQVLIRDPTEEPAALSVLAELLADVDFLVSFNGKAFDRNVLADRFVMNRLDPSRVLELPHVDLLHPARRLFRGVFAGCGLGQLEEACLGVFRHESEIRGAEVPERWFDFLRSGRLDLLEPVIEHNVLDVLSLVTLGGHLARCVEAPGLAMPQPRALVGAGRLLLDRGEGERGEEVLRMVARGDAGDPVAYAALRLLGDHLRKTGRYEEAIRLWRRMMEASGVEDLAPWKCAAVALEHRVGRPREALALVDRVLGQLGDEDPLHQPEIDSFKHRRARLAAKAAGAPAGPARAGGPGRGGSGV